MEKILIVEDDENILNIINYNLKNFGYDTQVATNGVEGLECAKQQDFDIVLLDINMPLMDGLEVCKKIREFSNVPIIMLTAKAEESDKITGLEAGADDYVTKPFSINELVARIKSNIRRTTTLSQKIAPSKFFIDEDKVQVVIDGKPLDFTPLEYKVIKYLYDNKPKVISREELLLEVWGYTYLSDERTVDVAIRRLRNKIESVSKENIYLYTKRGVGYYFDDSSV